MTKFSVRMNLVRETKGAVLYEEVSNDGSPVDKTVAKLAQMYVRKIALVPSIPATITVTVEAADVR